MICNKFYPLLTPDQSPDPGVINAEKPVLLPVYEGLCRAILPSPMTHNGAIDKMGLTL